MKLQKKLIVQKINVVPYVFALYLAETCLSRQGPANA